MNIQQQKETFTDRLLLVGASIGFMCLFAVFVAIMICVISPVVVVHWFFKWLFTGGE